MKTSQWPASCGRRTSPGCLSRPHRADALYAQKRGPAKSVWFGTSHLPPQTGRLISWKGCGLSQYSSLNNSQRLGGADGLQLLAAAATEWVVAHLSLDPSWIAPIAAGHGELVENFL